MPQAAQIPTSEVHLTRYYRSKRESVTEIAESDQVSEQTVKDSIRAVEAYRARHDVEAVNEATRAAVLDLIPETKLSLKRQLRAKNGKKQDYVVQRAAVAEVRGMIQVVQPKAPTVHATQVNLPGQQGNAPRIATGTYLGMEDRLKLITQEMSAAPVEERKQLTQAPLQSEEDGEFEEVEPVEEGSE